jgi:hypothetical protein
MLRRLFRRDREINCMDAEEIVQKGQAGKLDAEEKCCLQ